MSSNITEQNSGTERQNDNFQYFTNLLESHSSNDLNIDKNKLFETFLLFQDFLKMNSKMNLDFQNTTKDKQRGCCICIFFMLLYSQNKRLLL